jgi:hypothetical protein
VNVREETLLDETAIFAKSVLDGERPIAGPRPAAPDSRIPERHDISRHGPHGSRELGALRLGESRPRFLSRGSEASFNPCGNCRRDAPVTRLPVERDFHPVR